MRRALRIGRAHPLAAAALAMALVTALTLAAQQAASRSAPQAPQSAYDRYFSYGQIQAMTRFAACDAALFSTNPEDELENVKARMAIRVEYIAPIAPGQQGEYRQRLRDEAEIAQEFKLAREFYERADCN